MTVLAEEAVTWRMEDVVRETVHAHIVTNCPGFDQPARPHFPQCNNAVRAILRCHDKLKEIERSDLGDS